MRTEETIRKMITVVELNAAFQKETIPKSITSANMERSIKALNAYSTSIGIITGLTLALENDTKGEN